MILQYRCTTRSAAEERSDATERGSKWQVKAADMDPMVGDRPRLQLVVERVTFALAPWCSSP
jgi:hypothetical protein